MANINNMKPHGSKFEYEQQRNEELVRTYFELMEAATYICPADIYREVVNKPSSRFWVSEERAAIVIAAMMKGDQLMSMRPNKREMFREIFRRAMVIRNEKPELSIFEIACLVVMQQAPKFYLSPGSAEVYICTTKKGFYAAKKAKLAYISTARNNNNDD